MRGSPSGVCRCPPREAGPDRKPSRRRGRSLSPGAASATVRGMMVRSLVLAASLLASPLPALSHSGGLDRNGCHAGSRPYHCHNGGSSRSTARAVPQRIVPRADADLRRLQEALNRLGYDCGPADGYIGARTRSCIAAFHRDEGIGPDTDYVVTTRRANARQEARPATLPAPAAPLPLVSPDPAPSRAEVGAVQAFLAAQGFDVGRPDGVMGRRTEGAIRGYEARRGQRRTGRITPWLLGEVRTAAPVPAAEAAGFPVAAILTGVPRVVDGDGLAFGDVEVRLRGIAAPEDSGVSRQPGGPEATAGLRRLAEGREVVCRLDGTTTGRDTGNRPVGVCAVEGVDLGASLVRSGLARDCPAFSGGVYAEAETEARRAGRDLSRTYDLPGYCTSAASTGPHPRRIRPALNSQRCTSRPSRMAIVREQAR